MEASIVVTIDPGDEVTAAPWSDRVAVTFGEDLTLTFADADDARAAMGEAVLALVELTPSTRRSLCVHCGCEVTLSDWMAASPRRIPGWTHAYGGVHCRHHRTGRALATCAEPNPVDPEVVATTIPAGEVEAGDMVLVGSRWLDVGSTPSVDSRGVVCMAGSWEDMPSADHRHYRHWTTPVTVRFPRNIEPDSERVADALHRAEREVS